MMVVATFNLLLLHSMGIKYIVLESQVEVREEKHEELSIQKEH
jgi:hypothetical protein